MNETEYRKELQAQRKKLDSKIKRLQMLEKIEGCTAIRFSIFRSFEGWSDNFEILGTDLAELKKTIFSILKEDNE